MSYYDIERHTNAKNPSHPVYMKDYFTSLYRQAPLDEGYHRKA